MPHCPTNDTRYARHLTLPEIGPDGQELLLDSSVLIVGVGGLGSPLAIYLAAAGIGRIGLIDHDRVEISNLQRQPLYTTASVGQAKVSEARKHLAALNPDVIIDTYQENLDLENADAILASYDIICDGSDNFETRFLINNRCITLKKTLVSAAVRGFVGQLSTYKAYLGQGYPCYRCFCPEIPPPGGLPNCMEGGILGSVAGVMGSLQATEVVKELLQIGESLSGNILIYDGLKTAFRKVKLPKDNACKECGDS